MVSNPRSLRYRVLLVVVVIVVLPLVWVWMLGTFEVGDEVLQTRLLQAATEHAERALLSGRPLEQVAHEHEVHLRLLSPEGEVLLDLDETDERSMLSPFAEPFYGPSGRPRLSRVDQALPPLPERPEVVASALRPDARCEVAEEGKIFVCSAARRLPDGRVVHVMRGQARLVRSLYEQRFQLTALTLLVLVIGISVALVLGWRMVVPIEQLRDQVVARTQGRVSTEPVVLDRPDELGELANAFNQLLQAIEERNKANTAFAADLAHELKNPVAAVRAAAEALASDRPAEGERLVRLQRVLADSSRRMEVVVHQFLELARAEAGLPGADRERCDLYAMVSHLAEAARGDERYSGVSIEVVGEPACVVVVPERLETAVRNLLANACHHCQGRVRVAVHAREGGAGRMVELVVQDDGPGISPELLPHLFTRYHSHRAGGTGLGLSMTKAIIEAHGGHIVAESVPGQGATFRVMLPPAPAEPTAI
jgi:signal transduction histidine kinase